MRPNISVDRLHALGIVLVASLLAVVCGSNPPLARSYGSASELARAVLDAVERRDAATLQGLAVTEQEFRDHVWPELPAARPERNLPFSYVWSDLRQKSGNALAGTLSAYGGRHYDLVAARFTGETTQYRTYVVHRKSELTVKDAAGAEWQLRLYGSVIEKNGRLKVFSYVGD